jgi:hypothetical protein
MESLDKREGVERIPARKIAPIQRSAARGVSRLCRKAIGVRLQASCSSEYSEVHPHDTA